MGRREGRGGFEVIIHVQHVGKQRLGGRVDLLHLILHLNGLQGELLSRAGHPEEPGDPLEEDDPDLKEKHLTNTWLQHHSNLPSPACCGCGPSGGGS